MILFGLPTPRRPRGRHRLGRRPAYVPADAVYVGPIVPEPPEELPPAPMHWRPASAIVAETIAAAKYGQVISP